MTLSEILEEINRDRSEEWTNYDETDWEEGLNEFTQYELVSKGKPKLSLQQAIDWLTQYMLESKREDDVETEIYCKLILKELALKQGGN